MAIYCPSCRHQFDVTLFQFGNAVICDCGAVVGAEIGLATGLEVEQTRREMRALRRLSDRVSAVILSTGSSDREIDWEIERMRSELLERYPHRAELFEMIYASRFRRLREQFRP